MTAKEIAPSSYEHWRVGSVAQCLALGVMGQLALAQPLFADTPPDGVAVFRDTCLTTAPEFDCMAGRLEALGYTQVADHTASRAIHLTPEAFTVYLRGDRDTKSPGSGRRIRQGRGPRRAAFHCLVLIVGMSAPQIDAALSDLLKPEQFLTEREGLFYTVSRKWIVTLPGDADLAALISVTYPAGARNRPGAQLALEVFEAAVIETVFDFARWRDRLCSMFGAKRGIA